jgi:misacylated tRNA(Ala) deacylase
MRYHDDPAATVLRAAVLRCEAVGGRFEALLADTVLFPEGGGQPDDHGTVDDRPVLGLRREEGGVVHILGAPVAGEVTVRLDRARRLDLSQQHTGQHLLSAVAADRFGLPTTAFHLGPERADVELEGELDPRARLALEEAVNTIIREDRPVRVRTVSVAEMAGLPVRSRGLPEGFSGAVRLVEIEGVDLNTCGGTHLSRTAELQVISLIEVERLKRSTRLHFLVGGRVNRALHGLLEREAALTRLLTCPPAEHLAAIERAVDEAKRGGKARQALSRELAAAIGQGLSPMGEPPTLLWHREEADPAFLSAVADAVLARHPGALCVLTAGDRDGVFLVAGPEARVKATGPQVAAALEGRGGGAKGRFQGKAARVDLRGGLGSALG